MTERPESEQNDFEAASQEKELSLLGEIVEFIVEYKKWWLIPIVVSLGLIGVLAVLAATGAAPFIYSFF